MSSIIDISELRVGYVLGAPIYDDHNVKLLGQGVTITDNFVRQIRRRGTRTVQVTDEDLAKLRGWKLSVDSPTEVKHHEASVVTPKHESRIDHTRFGRFLATIAQVGRQTRSSLGPLKMIRSSAQLAADALHAEHYGFGLVFPNAKGMSFFLGARTADGEQQKMQRRNIDLSTDASLLAASMASDAPIFVEDLSAEGQFHEEILADLYIHSAATVPLHRGTLRAGLMAVFYQQARQLDDHDLSFLETIANIVTVPSDIDLSEMDAESDDIDEVNSSMNRRYDYDCWQGIAPLLGDQIPLRSSYEDVRCRDISMAGFSFYYPRRPEFRQLAVALGQAPQLKQMKATVVSCCGTELDGEPCSLVGCRFTGPLATA